jgi:hypothetical protein
MKHLMDSRRPAGPYLPALNIATNLLVVGEKEMKLMSRTLYALAIVCFIAALGSRAEAATRLPASAVPNQTAASALIQEWSQILWGLVTSQTGTGTPSFGDPIFNDDGSITQSYIAADGTQATLTFFPDGSARFDILLPNGASQTVLQSPPSPDWTTTDYHITSSDGLSITYTSVVDFGADPFNANDDTTQLIGTSTLPGGSTQTFSVLTVAAVTEGWTNVQSTQSDGSTFTLTVPLALPDFILPDFSQPATGVYSRAGLNTNFTLTSTPTYPFRWAALVSDLGGGVTGAFSLKSDFSGLGQFTKAGRRRPIVLALLSWTREGRSTVRSLNGRSRAMGPAGTALDCLKYKWLTLTALFAPTPGL